MPTDPEIHHLEPNAYAPNSELPVLVYRDVLPLPLTETTATTFLEGHGWERRGVWGHIAVRHFHPNSHECYGGCYLIQLDGDLIPVLYNSTEYLNLDFSSKFSFFGFDCSGRPQASTTTLPVSQSYS
jgi:hypothetical protein